MDRLAAAGLLALAASAAGCRVAREPERDPDGAIPVRVDTGADRRPISPLIYGSAYSGRDGAEIRCPLNRFGGNNITRYNWKNNADNKGADWYFESIASPDPTPGERAATFVRDSRAAGAQPMITIPMIGWTTRLGPKRGRLWSFSVRKYGPQQKVDPEGLSDAGNGKRPDGSDIVGNDPRDANTPASLDHYRPWIEQLARAGVPYYLLDNEPGLWHSTHRDVCPVGVRTDDLLERMRATAALVKAIDPRAKVCGPEEWGWTGYLYSGYDAQWGARHGWRNLLKPLPDRAAHGGEDLMTTLLRRFATLEKQTGKRLLDVFTLHYYPQGGEFGGGVDPAMQKRRNRSTRSLWDPGYRDETWIDDTVRLIPRMREWVARNYPGTPIGLTEYNWGAEDHINGATAQADVFGILGREGMDLAARWAQPDRKTPTYKVFQLYRNADGHGAGFGDLSVRCVAPNPDDLAAFAALDRKSGALTLVLVAKESDGPRTVRLALNGFRPSGPGKGWRLTSDNAIESLPPRTDPLRLTLPPQSVTLLVLPPAA